MSKEGGWGAVAEDSSRSELLLVEKSSRDSGRRVRGAVCAVLCGV